MEELIQGFRVLLLLFGPVLLIILLIILSKDARPPKG
jgi:hypothetical protein